MAASKGCTENEINLTTEIQKIRETNFYIVVTHMFVSYISLTSQNHKKNTHTHTHTHTHISAVTTKEGGRKAQAHQYFSRFFFFIKTNGLIDRWT